MRRRTLWWTWWPSVHLHCEPQNHELKSHYREWGRDRDAGHLFAWTKLCGLLAGYICGRVDRICDIDPSTEVLLFYSWLFLAASHGLWHCYLCWHRISYATPQWERPYGVWIQIQGGTLLPWSVEWGQSPNATISSFDAWVLVLLFTTLGAMIFTTLNIFWLLRVRQTGETSPEVFVTKVQVLPAVTTQQVVSHSNQPTNEPSFWSLSMNQAVGYVKWFPH